MLLCPMAAVLWLNGVMMASQPVMLVLGFAPGAIALALGPPIHMLLMQKSKGAEMLGSSLGQSEFNIGNVPAPCSAACR